MRLTETLDFGGDPGRVGCRRGVRAEAERREPEILRAGAGSIRRLPEVGLATCPLLGGLIWRLGRQWVENLIPSLVPQLYPYICQTFLVFFFFFKAGLCAEGGHVHSGAERDSRLFKGFLYPDGECIYRTF